nr:zinc knuckle CX2CX4HX4C [Tanacetum cinerariifolium]
MAWLNQCLTHLPGYSLSNFSSMDGLNAMVENGPWFIRNHPLILKKKNPHVNLLKEDEEYPKNPGLGVAKNLKKPSQAPRGVPVGSNVGFKPAKEYRPISKKPTATTSGTKKKGDHDSEDEVELVDNDMARSMDLERVGFGTKSLMEQWRDTYENGIISRPLENIKQEQWDKKIDCLLDPKYAARALKNAQTGQRARHRAPRLESTRPSSRPSSTHILLAANLRMTRRKFNIANSRGLNPLRDFPACIPRRRVLEENDPNDMWPVMQEHPMPRIFWSKLWLIQMARRVSDYRIHRIADRGNKEDGPDSRARGDRFYHNRRSADRCNEKVDRDLGNISEIKGLRRRVRDLEIQHEIRQIRKRIRELELQWEMMKETESRYVVRDDVNEEEEWILEGVSMARSDGSIFTFNDIERNEREKGLVEGDGPTVVTGGPVASMATFSFVPKVQVGLLVEAIFTNLNLEGDLIKSPITVGSPINFKWQNKDNIVVAKNAQRKGNEASNGVMEPHANNDTVDFGLYVKNDFFNKIGLVDCGPQDQMGRKDYEGPTTTSLDVLNSLSSKIVTTKCAGAELFERFKLIAKSDRSNAPYDPCGTGLIPGEMTREVKLFRRVMVTLINGSRVDVPFDPGDFAPKAKLEDEFFQDREDDAGASHASNILVK